MVRKLKVVDVVQEEAAQPVEEEVKPVEQESSVVEPVAEEIKPVEEEIKPVEEEIKPVEAPTPAKEKIKPTDKKTKEPVEIVCENCNKKMLMKTYKYSHQKLCKPAEPPAPTPTPAPTPAPTPKKQPDTQFSKEAVNTVSFDQYSQPLPNGNAYLNNWNELRQQRQIVRQQRVKSLISQAI